MLPEIEPLVYQPLLGWPLQRNIETENRRKWRSISSILLIKIRYYRVPVVALLVKMLAVKFDNLHLIARNHKTGGETHF